MQKIQKTITKIRTSKVVAGITLVALIASVPAINHIATAAECRTSAECNAKISELQRANNGTQGTLNSLLAESKNYEAAIATLQAQINDVTAVIRSNEAKQAEIRTQIAEKQAEIDYKRKVLGTAVKTMYVDDQMTTIEMLATSKDLSEFVDKEEYRNAVQNQIQKTMKEIVALQEQLRIQERDVATLLENQRAQEAQLASARAQQNQLLSMNKAQQGQFNAQIAANNSEIKKLRAAQAAIISAGSSRVNIPPASGGSGGRCDNGGGNGGYPMRWCDAPMDTIVTINSEPNNRQCTSYAYWYFKNVLGNSSFRTAGNAKAWAYSTNYATSSSPSVGAIAVDTTGTYGHVAVVHAMPGDTYRGVTVPTGKVLVSEMNYDWDGHFRFSLANISKWEAFIPSR